MTYALTPRLVAIQGFELTPVALAVQGLIAFLEGGGTTGGRMRATTVRRLQKIRDVRFRLGGARGGVVARAVAPRVVPLAPVSVAQTLFAPLVDLTPTAPDPTPVFIPVVTNVRAALRRGRAVVRLRTLLPRVPCRTSLPSARGYAAAKGLGARSSIRTELRCVRATAAARDFDEMYAERNITPEEMLLLALEFI